MNKTHDDVSGRGGWEYLVKEEELFVNGILKVFLKEHKTMPLDSVYSLPEFPGLRISEVTRNDD